MSWHLLHGIEAVYPEFTISHVISVNGAKISAVSIDIDISRTTWLTHCGLVTAFGRHW